MIVEWLAATAATLGALLLVSGSIGLLRFPDTYTRLHALAKADTLGLGLVALGVGLHRGGIAVALKLLLLWLLVMAASALLSYLIAHAASASGSIPWKGNR